MNAASEQMRGITREMDTLLGDMSAVISEDDKRQSEKMATAMLDLARDTVEVLPNHQEHQKFYLLVASSVILARATLTVLASKMDYSE